MSNVHVFDHPLIGDKLARMRRKSTPPQEFRLLLYEISLLMGYEVTRNLPTVPVEVETPLRTASFPMLASNKYAIVPILRAGIGMVDGLLQLMPFARVGHIGLQREEKTHEPVEYFCKLPKDIAESVVIVVDPMLATGASAAEAIDSLKARGVEHISLMNLLAAPEGIKTMQERHPDVDIFVAAVDEGLDENAYIVPGVGDAGDRIFGTY